MPPPELTIVAGPNGSGKSTVTSKLRLRDRMPMLDPDAIARLTNPADPAQAALSAGRETLEQWQRFVERRISFGVETTLAGVGPISRIRLAKAVGYRIRIYYVALDTDRLNIERVKQRVLRGGHNIPGPDIRRRYQRSLENAPIALSLADHGTILDNSFHEILTVAEITSGKLTWQADTVPPWAAKILAPLAT